MTSDLKNIFSSGGGTQSAAIAALIVQGRLPKPDFVCIVDTERERGSTWEYLDAVIRPALQKVGLEVHRIRKSIWGTKPPHGVDYLSHNGSTVLLPNWTDQTGEPGKTPGYCSKTWKVETLQRYAREVLGVPTKKQRSWIGFSLDESRRAVRMMAGADYKADLLWFPLIHGVPLKRQQAIQLVEDMGWPTPPRSACWMCPNNGDGEWRHLKATAPHEFQMACELEKELQKHNPFLWMHRSCKPLAEVDFSEPDDLFRDVPCSTGGCMT